MAYRSMQKRWRRNKRNRVLRRKIAELEVTIQNYTKQLAKEQWHHICDQLKGALSMRKTWTLLRPLLNPQNNRTDHTHNIQKLVHLTPGTISQLMDQLRSIYIPDGMRVALPDYQGEKTKP